MPKRLLAISDPHGRYDEFIYLLRCVKFRADDTLVVLGDMIDRGPKSAQIVDYLMNVRSKADVRVLMGNHEHMFLMYMAGYYPGEHYLNNFVGGEATMKSYDSFSVDQMEKHLEFLSALPKTIEIGKYVFTHGGLDINKPLGRQTLKDTCWDEGSFYKSPGLPGRTVVFGHHQTHYIYQDVDHKDVQDSRIWRDPIYHNKIGIDCGFRGSKKLACLDLTNNIEYYCTVYSKKMEVIQVA